MSSLIFKRGSRCPCSSLPSRVVLTFRFPRVSPVLLLGIWTLLYVAYNLRSSTLVWLDARLFDSPAAAINPENAVLFSLSGDSDAPLGSWNATQVIPVSIDGHTAASMQQLKVVQGKELHREQDNEREDKVNERVDGKKAGKNEGEKEERERRLPTVSPTSLQQAPTFHGNKTPRRAHKHQQPQLEYKKITSSQQRNGSLLQQQLQQPEGRRVVLHQRRQKPPLQRQRDQTNFQKLTADLASEQRGQPSGSGAYIQSLATAIAQQSQQQRKGRQDERELQQGESRIATSDRMHRHVVSRQSEADVKPVLLSSEEDGDGAGGSKQMRRHVLLEAQRIFKTNEATEHAPQYPSTVASSSRNNSLLATQRKSPFFGKGGEGEALLETRVGTRGIGTILAGAGLSTLLGGLNQYQQGPLAAGPPGSAVAQPGGFPVSPAAPALPAPAVAATAASGVPGVPFGAAPAAANPFAAAAMTPAPQVSSGHNIIPITVGIILGLIVLCLVGGCIFKLTKKKKRR